MKEFKTYHPLVNLIYFVLVIGFSMFFMHPVCLCMSLACALLYSSMLKGKRALKSLLYMIPLLVITALINPLFSHGGATVIAYFPGGNPLTLESVIYGLASAVMIASVISWFSCYNQVMTSDKFIYLFGRIIPSISLIISMTLAFVPEFTRRFKVVSDAQQCMGRSLSGGSIINRAKCGLGILSATLSWSMENAVETADSMKARGYGLPDRTAFSIYTFDKRDAKALLGILLLGAYTLFGAVVGGMDFGYFPEIQAARLSPFEVSIFAAYLLLFIYPVIIEILEARKWKALR